MKTQHPILVYDTHIYHYLWCPQSLYNRYFTNLEIKPEHELKSVTGMSVNGNPYWLEKPDIQKILGKTSESESLYEFMSFMEESGSFEDIPTKSLVHDPKNNVLLNVDYIAYRLGNWCPVISTFNPEKMWFKNAILITAMCTALENSGFKSQFGFISDHKTGQIRNKYTVTKSIKETYLLYLEDIRKILSGKDPEVSNALKCKKCAFDGCSQEAIFNNKEVIKGKHLKI